MLDRYNITLEYIIKKLQKYWEKLGFIILQPTDTEVGAGTLNLQTFLNIFKFNTWNCAYIERCKRPLDSCYGKNMDKLQSYFQFQVINKPSFYNIKTRYIDSLSYIGFNLKHIDLKFIKDNWEHPGLGAYGTGWEIWLGGLEITQLTYLKQCGGITIDTNCTEITYGLERIVKVLQEKTSNSNIIWHKNNTKKSLIYNELSAIGEYESSLYNFYLANIEFYHNMFADLYKQACLLIDNNIIIPSYEKLLKCSHVLNILDALGILSAIEKMRYIKKLQVLSHQCVYRYQQTKFK